MSTPRRIAVASRSFSRHPLLRAELIAAHPQAQITFNDAGKSLAGAELIDFLSGHDHAITALERLDADTLAALPELEAIGKYGVGLDMIDLDSMRRLGKRLGWTGGVNRRSVTELVLSAAIALLRRIPEANLEVRSGTFRQLMGRHLSDRVIGIVGCGHIGKDLAAILVQAFNCTVLAHDILDFPEFYARHHIVKSSLEDLLRQADVVTLHLPLDASTRQILNAERLALMRPDAILINAARGGLVDESALKTMLKSGKLAGAAFDVFDPEPPQDEELLNLPNFLATPHIGGSAEEAVILMGRAAIRGLTDNRIPD